MQLGKKILCLIFVFGTLFAQTGDDPRYYLDEGVRLYRDEHYYRAIDSLKTALRLNPHYGDAYRYMAQIYFSLNDFEMSLENAQQALKYSHNDTDAMLLVANSLRELGKYAEAEKVYENIRQKYPAYVAVYRDISELYLRMNRLPQSYQMLEKAMRISKSQWENYIALGDYYSKLGDSRQAEENYQKAMQLNSRDRKVFIKLADYYYRAGNIKSAIAILEKGEALFENFVSGVGILADSYLHAGQSAKAAEKYEWLEQNLPRMNDETKSWLYTRLAMAYEKIDKNKAVDTYEKALQADPQNQLILASYERFAAEQFPVGDSVREKLAQGHFETAMKSLRRGEMDKYYLQLKRAIYLNPFLVEAREKLVEYYENRQDYYSAYQELKSLFKVHRDFKIKDKIEKYDWKIAKNQLQLNQAKLYEYQGLFLVEPGYYNFSEVYSDMVLYTSQYYDKFKFTVLEYRKSEGVNRLLEYVRDNGLNFFIIAELNPTRTDLTFTVYDKVGKILEERTFPFDLKNVQDSIFRFFRWLDEVFPTVGFVNQQLSSDTYRLSLGQLNGWKRDDEILIFDYRNDIESVALLSIVKNAPIYSDCTVISNMNKSLKISENKKALKSDNLTKKHLTKLKRILVY